MYKSVELRLELASTLGSGQTRKRTRFESVARYLAMVVCRNRVCELILAIVLSVI